MNEPDDAGNRQQQEQVAIDKATVDAHRLLVMWLFIATLILGLAFLFVMLNLDRTGSGPSIMVVVIVSGALGGFVSSLRRLYSFQDIFPRKQYVELFRRTNFYVIAYSFVPVQDFSRGWSDEDLYAKYDLSEDEITLIESTIRPMPVGDE